MHRPTAAGLCLAFLLTGSAAAGVLHHKVEARIAAAPAGEFIDAYVVLADQMSPREARRAADMPGAAERTARAVRRRVAERLEQHAAATQREVRAALDAEIAAGRAELVDVLWIGNALIVRATGAALGRLAAVPGVDRIRLVERPDPATYLDRVAAASPVAAYPLSDSFDGCSLPAHWTVATSGAGAVQCTSAHGPVGSCHVTMQSATAGVQSTASMTVVLDLAGRFDVGIRFKYKEFSDEAQAGDGVFVSADGVTFHRIHALGNGSGTYQTRQIELDPAVAALGLAYTSRFHVRLAWQDESPIPSDGCAFDDVVIGPGAGSPPPAPIEPNITALEAPLLWNRGIKGSGVVVACIDLGTDVTHPDLAKRTWKNPGEIAGNNVDDDGNGKKDDVLGWDFVENDGNVNPGLEDHGTLAAGLIVGDGTAGSSTGMAPRASLLVCRIAGEVNYWQAQQYCLQMGVDVVSSSHSYKWPAEPDYAMHRQICAMELAAGILHANSIGNQGASLATFPIPFNIPAPANVPGPWRHPAAVDGGLGSVMGCAAILLGGDAIDVDSGRGPAAWENVLLYDPGYGHAQDPTFFDYPYGGFGGGQPGLLKPDIATYTNVLSTDNFDDYLPFAGTSAATPQLGGAMALLRQAQPNAFPRHVAAAIELTAKDLGPPGKDARFGAGRLRVHEAARRLVVLGRFDDPTPAPGATMQLDLFGEPNAPVWVFLGAGPATATSPWSLNLAPPVFLLGVLQLDGTGALSFPVAVANDPAQVGASGTFQFASLPSPSWGALPLLSVPETVTIE